MIVLRNSCIKGYHIFRIKPHPEIKMLVQNEDGNKYNPFAMLIRMPELINIYLFIYLFIYNEYLFATELPLQHAKLLFFKWVLWGLKYTIKFPIYIHQ